MILEYNYDKMLTILENFKNAKLASLIIQLAPNEENFIMEYTYVNDFPEEKQDTIRETLKNSLSDRLNAINILNKFIEAQALNNVIDFKFDFNAVNVRKCNINYHLSCKKVPADQKMVTTKDIIQCLENLESLATKMGIMDVEIKNAFRKEPGKGKKAPTITIRRFSEILRLTLLGEHNNGDNSKN